MWTIHEAIFWTATIIARLMSLVFIPQSIWNWRFDVARENGKNSTRIAEVWIGSVRSRGTITVAEIEIDVGIRGFLRPRFRFEHDGREMATGGTDSMMRTRMWLESRGVRYDLRGRKLGRALEVSRDGEVLGSIATRGIFSRGGHIDLPESLPMHDRLFMLAMAMYHWRQQAAAAAS